MQVLNPKRVGDIPVILVLIKTLSFIGVINILHEIHKRKANWIGHILRRNCLLQRVTEGKIQGG